VVTGRGEASPAGASSKDNLTLRAAQPGIKERTRDASPLQLPGYYYMSPGFSFVTICVHGGECLRGEGITGRGEASPANTSS
jgi:hypothetical protein